MLAEVHPDQVGAGRDLQLGEHLAQVVVDRARAQEQLRADFPVGHPFGYEVCDLQLLRGELIAGGGIAAAGRLSARPKLGARPLFPGREREPLEQLERGS